MKYAADIASSCSDPVAELRHVHLGMLDAVLAGGGVASVARIAAGALDGTVVVTLPALDLTVCAPDGDDRRVTAVRRHVEDRSAPTPLELAAEAPVRRGGEPLGAVVLLGGRRRAPVAADQVLRLAALAVLTAVTLETGSGGAPAAGAGALFAALRGEPDADVVAARARELGCDLSHGGVALCAAPESGTVQRTLAALVQEAPRALVHAERGIVEALVPEPGQAAAGPGAAELDALQTGPWRLLTRLAVMAPAEIERLLATTLGPLLDPRTRSRCALLETLATYLPARADPRADRPRPAPDRGARAAQPGAAGARGARRAVRR